MRLLLLQPPVRDFYDTDVRLQPIGLCFLKAAVKKHLPHMDVIVKDFHQGHGRKTIPWPPELHYLKEYYLDRDQGPFSTFDQYYHFGASIEKIVQEVAAWAPDLVGISSLFSPYYREVLEVAKAIRERLQIPIILGGSHVSACPELMLASSHVDFVIRGEGERPLVEFLKIYEKGDNDFSTVPNLGYKKEGKLCFNSLEENYDICSLPVPDLSDLDLGAYQFAGKPLSFLITSRSCPHKCSFCSVHQTFGFKYRRKKVKQVIEEMLIRYQEGYRVFDFEDDNLTYYRHEMKELCLEIIKNFPQKDIELLAMNGISYLSLDVELLQLMKEAGFTHLNLALVTSDQSVRESTKRPHTVQKFVEVVEVAHGLGMQIVSYQILGLPQESLSSMCQTLVFMARLPVLMGASLFYLTPNSPIAKLFPPRNEEDIFKSRLTAMAIETNAVKREHLYTLFIITRIINFLKGLKLTRTTPIEELLASRSNYSDSRLQLGLELLVRLLQEGKLYLKNKKGFREITKFDVSLFELIWNELKEIKTQEGFVLKLPKFSPALTQKNYTFSEKNEETSCSEISCHV